MKKYIMITLALLVVFALAVPAMAAGTKYSFKSAKLAGGYGKATFTASTKCLTAYGVVEEGNWPDTDNPKCINPDQIVEIGFCDIDENRCVPASWKVRKGKVAAKATIQIQSCKNVLPYVVTKVNDCYGNPTYRKYWIGIDDDSFVYFDIALTNTAINTRHDNTRGILTLPGKNSWNGRRGDPFNVSSCPGAIPGYLDTDDWECDDGECD
jgi:hypothetical protein